MDSELLIMVRNKGRVLESSWMLEWYDMIWYESYHMIEFFRLDRIWNRFIDIEVKLLSKYRSKCKRVILAVFITRLWIRFRLELHRNAFSLFRTHSYQYVPYNMNHIIWFSFQPNKWAIWLGQNFEPVDYFDGWKTFNLKVTIGCAKVV